MRQRLIGTATLPVCDPLRPISTFSISRHRIHLDGRTYPLYSGGGESGIGIAEVLGLGGRAGRALGIAPPGHASRIGVHPVLELSCGNAAY